MATHASIFAWEISWTEETGGLYSPWGCTRVGQNSVAKQQQQTTTTGSCTQYLIIIYNGIPSAKT